jgi:hypothetical protein
MTLLADVVSASQDLGHTSSRSEKVAILAERLGLLDASEVAVAVGFLVGVPRQGRVGIGYSTIYGIERGRLHETAVHGRPSRLSGHRLADRQRSAARGERDLPLRRPPQAVWRYVSRG